MDSNTLSDRLSYSQQNNKEIFFLILFLSTLNVSESRHIHLTRCSKDDDCVPTEFCYETGFCANCTDCGVYHRQQSSNICAKEPAQCGPCLHGYKEEMLAGNKNKDACTLILTTNIGDASVSSIEDTGGGSSDEAAGGESGASVITYVTISGVAVIIVVFQMIYCLLKKNSIPQKCANPCSLIHKGKKCWLFRNKENLIISQNDSYNYPDPSGEQTTAVQSLMPEHDSDRASGRNSFNPTAPALESGETALRYPLLTTKAQEQSGPYSVDECLLQTSICRDPDSPPAYSSNDAEMAEEFLDEENTSEQNRTNNSIPNMDYPDDDTNPPTNEDANNGHPSNVTINNKSKVVIIVENGGRMALGLSSNNSDFSNGNLIVGSSMKNNYL